MTTTAPTSEMARPGNPRGATRATPTTSSAATDLHAAFEEFDAKIKAGMQAYAIPGAAVAVWAGGHEYVKGYGVTNIDHPLPVDGDTVFRIGSTTKTFTGTAIMRLVDQGKVDLDAPVRRYLPDFAWPTRLPAPR